MPYPERVARAIPGVAAPAGERRTRVHRRAARVARPDPRPRRRVARDHRRRLRLHAIRRARRDRQGARAVRRRADAAARRAQRGAGGMTRCRPDWAQRDARRGRRDLTTGRSEEPPATMRTTHESTACDTTAEPWLRRRSRRACTHHREHASGSRTSTFTAATSWWRPREVAPRARLVPRGIGPAIVKADLYPRPNAWMRSSPRFSCAMLDSPPVRAREPLNRSRESDVHD